MIVDSLIVWEQMLLVFVIVLRQINIMRLFLLKKQAAAAMVLRTRRSRA
jgi:hypothetical protein